MPRGVRIALIAGAALAVALIVAIAVVALSPAASTSPTASPTTTPTPSETPTPTVTPTPTPTPTFNKALYPIDQASSLWVVVNKTRPLNPINYAPPLTNLAFPGGKGQLRPEAAAGLQKMFADYQAQTGDHFTVVSPYRGYTTQVSVYNGWVAKLGKAQADRQSARPGYSEHQTGLAVDVNTAVSQAFGATPPGMWIAANSWKYGFIVRYPDGSEPVTGYEYEPWHLRFVGVELATELHTTGIQTLEQFFGLPDAPDYPN